MESRIITLFSNNEIEIVWCSQTGKTRIKPDGEWLEPEKRQGGVDYKFLLMKYLTYLEEVEGSNLLKRRSSQDGVQFTDEEWAELVELAGNQD